MSAVSTVPLAARLLGVLIWPLLFEPHPISVGICAHAYSANPEATETITKVTQRAFISVPGTRFATPPDRQWFKLDRPKATKCLLVQDPQHARRELLN
jgi:hypothetical protein